MTSAETLKTILYVVGIIVSLPFTIALFRVSFHAGGIAKAVEGLGRDIKETNDAMKEFATEVRECLTDHTADIANIKGQIEGWDGSERRQQERRTG